MWSWEKEFGEGTEDNEMSQGGGRWMRMNQLCEGTEENYKNYPVWIAVKSLGFGNQMPHFKSKLFHFLREVTQTFYASVFSL